MAEGGDEGRSLPQEPPSSGWMTNQVYRVLVEWRRSDLWKRVSTKMIVSGLHCAESNVLRGSNAISKSWTCVFRPTISPTWNFMFVLFKSLYWISLLACCINLLKGEGRLLRTFQNFELEKAFAKKSWVPKVDEEIGHAGWKVEWNEEMQSLKASSRLRSKELGFGALRLGLSNDDELCQKKLTKALWFESSHLLSLVVDFCAWALRSVSRRRIDESYAEL